MSEPEYANYLCGCGNNSVKMIHVIGCGKYMEASPWLCQCDKCKNIEVLYILEYNYQTKEHNKVILVPF